MFWGHLDCAQCGFRTDNFMCGPHWDSWSFGILIQNITTKSLRVFWIRDDESHNWRLSNIEEDDSAAFDAFAVKAVLKELQPNERWVQLNEFMNGTDYTVIPCPHCHQNLGWQYTGIS